MKWLSRFAAALALVAATFTSPFVHTAHAVAMSDALENSVVDWFFRGQTFTAPTNLFVGLSTTACSESATGTEVTGGAYARVQVASSLANWAGTQGAGTTVASSGSSGTTSNNGAITFPAPTANWGTVTHFFISSAASGGTLYFCSALTQAKTINNGDAAPAFSAGALTIQIDN
jgi:hypothetical protein